MAELNQETAQTTDTGDAWGETETVTDSGDALADSTGGAIDGPIMNFDFANLNLQMPSFGDPFAQESSFEEASSSLTDYDLSNFDSALADAADATVTDTGVEVSVPDALQSTEFECYAA